MGQRGLQVCVWDVSSCSLRPTLLPHRDARQGWVILVTWLFNLSNVFCFWFLIISVAGHSSFHLACLQITHSLLSLSSVLSEDSDGSPVHEILHVVAKQLNVSTFYWQICVSQLFCFLLITIYLGLNLFLIFKLFF